MLLAQGKYTSRFLDVLYQAPGAAILTESRVRARNRLSSLRVAGLATVRNGMCGRTHARQLFTPNMRPVRMTKLHILCSAALSIAAFSLPAMGQGQGQSHRKQHVGVVCN